MGQADLPIQPGDPISEPDAPQAYEATDIHDSFANAIKSADDAKDFMKLALLTHSIRTKIAFLSDLWSRIKTNQGMSVALTQSDMGKAWIDVFAKSEGAFLSFTQANNLSNIGVIRSVLETDILPRQFGIGAIGTMPIFVAGGNSLEKSAVSTVSSITPITYDFGDLSETTLYADVVEFEALKNKLSGYSLGDPIALALIWGSVIVIVALLGTYAVKRYFDSLQIPPDLLDLLKKMKDVDPKAAADLFKTWTNANHLMGDVVDVLKWAVIAIGGVVVVGGGIYLLSSGD